MYLLRYISSAYTVIDDAAKMSREIRDHMPGRDKEAKTEAKLLASEAGAKVDSTVSISRTLQPILLD